MRSMCANGVLMDVVRAAEGTRYNDLRWHGRRRKRRRRRRRRMRARRRTDAADRGNPRRLLQVEMHQSCPKSG